MKVVIFSLLLLYCIAAPIPIRKASTTSASLATLVDQMAVRVDSVQRAQTYISASLSRIKDIQPVLRRCTTPVPFAASTTTVISSACTRYVGARCEGACNGAFFNAGKEYITCNSGINGGSPQWGTPDFRCTHLTETCDVTIVPNNLGTMFCNQDTERTSYCPGTVGSGCTFKCCDGNPVNELVCNCEKPAATVGPAKWVCQNTCTVPCDCLPGGTDPPISSSSPPETEPKTCNGWLGPVPGTNVLDAQNQPIRACSPTSSNAPAGTVHSFACCGSFSGAVSCNCNGNIGQWGCTGACQHT